MKEKFLEIKNDLEEQIKLLEDSITNYSKAIELKPNYAEAYFNRGQARAELIEKVKLLEAINYKIAIL